MLAGDGGGKSAGTDSLFTGVRFVLLGFDPVSVSQYRSELLRRGGVDVGHYDSSCTHVIVSGLIYDDPVCVAARKDRKIVVTELWIEDCVDFNRLADASRILYRPVRDLKGIPGTDSLYICLTGYQRPERDDIMKMVEQMGAHFSKPLIATKITHLICYKFEGEKYELAKRVNIKLVNHRWLEDCLREWKILPTENYSKSGWELEILEAQAQDSEDDLDTGNASHLIDNAHTRESLVVATESKVVSDKLVNIRGTDNGEPTSDMIKTGPPSTPNSDHNLTASTLIGSKISYNPGSLINNEAKRLSSSSRLGLSSSKPVPDGSLSSFRKTPSKPVDVENSNGTIASAQGNSLQNKTDICHEPRDKVSCQNTETDKHGNTDVQTEFHNINQTKVSNSGISYLQKRNISDQKPTSCSPSLDLQQSDDGVLPNSTPGSKIARSEPDSATNGSKRTDQSPLHKFSDGYSDYGGLASSDSNVCHDMKSNTSSLSCKRKLPMTGLQLSRTKNLDTVASTGNLAEEIDAAQDRGDRPNPSLGSTSKVPSSRNLMCGTTMSDAVKVEATSISTSKGKDRELDNPTCLADSKADDFEFITEAPNDGLMSNFEEPKENNWTGNPTALDPDGSKKRVSENLKVYKTNNARISVDGTSNSAVKENLVDEQIKSAVKEILVDEQLIDADKNTEDMDVDEKRAAVVLEKNKGRKRTVTRPKKSAKAEPCPKEVVNKDNEGLETRNALDSDASRIPVVKSPFSFEETNEKPPSDGALRSTEIENLGNAEISCPSAGVEDKVITEIKSAQNVAAVAGDQVVKASEGALKPRKILGGKRILTINKKSLVSKTCSGFAVKENLKILNPDTVDCHMKEVSVDQGSKPENKTDSGLASPVISMTLNMETSCNAETIRADTAAEGVDICNDVVEPSPKKKKLKGRGQSKNQKSGIIGSCPKGTSGENKSNETPVDQGSKSENKTDNGTSSPVITRSVNMGSSCNAETNRENTTAKGHDTSENEVEPSPKKKKVKGRGRSKNQKNGIVGSSPKGTPGKNKSNEIPVDQGSKPEKETGNGTASPMISRPVTMESSRNAEATRANTTDEANGICGDEVEPSPKKKKVKVGGQSKNQKSGTADTCAKNISGKNKLNKKLQCSISTEVTDKEVEQEVPDFSKDSEKENRPLGSVTPVEQQSKNRSEVTQIGKRILSARKGLHEKNVVVPQTERVLQMIRSEPAVFIVSGHRYQRKEFQKIIRGLRGRVCRDSHQWSYQATHFIAPEPLRRTEKLFAAAAAGRWILKIDYLSASNEAGKFLDEHPYEWHRNGLSEDGAISMEAPRKWRLLRERTGHGALYGFNIIIYGECIAPSLDTLKRVVNAGDGTILATSPPYTRFLDKGIDFAVISPAMTRADPWIQAFLQHKIPCVLADYLVEYVCKPGYPLDRHVLFSTLDWANKSLANLIRRSEEVIPMAPSEPEDDDVSCAVCGSRDRADVMLICGSEDGTSGCGVGTHIDCCNPLLDSVPLEDWYCPKCRKSRGEDEEASAATPVSKKKKGKASRKRRL